MGIGDYINWATQKVPSMSTDKQVCWTSYDHGCFVVSSVGKSVRCIPVPKLPESVQDPETQATIKHFASVLGKNAAESALHESLKLFIPGGYLISKSYIDFHKSGGGKDKKIKELEAEVRRLKMESAMVEVSSSKEVELFKDLDMKTEHLNAPDMMNRKVFQAPEDVLRVFMMKSFIGSHLLVI
ncbi:hypothetical protein QQ045_033506 [Rhodiola kirilowii]